MIQPLWGTVWRFLKNLGVKLSWDPAIPTLDTYRKKTISEKDTWTPVFTAELCTKAKIWNNLDVQNG